MKWLDKLMGQLPLDYEQGYIDGFTEGLKFYKGSIDAMHKAVLNSEEVNKQMKETAKKLRQERG